MRTPGIWARLSVPAWLLLPAAVVVAGGWEGNDDHEMHFPQLPDPDGWDVPSWVQERVGDPGQEESVRAGFFRDDWRCRRTGPVTEIHFWVSMKDDLAGPDPQHVPFRIHSLRMGIAGNIPEGPEGFSLPGGTRWAGAGTEHTLRVRYAGRGQQRWFDPATGKVGPTREANYYQVSVTDIADPFVQQQGETYWLMPMISLARNPITGDRVELGWKTADLKQYPNPHAGDLFGGSAVYVFVRGSMGVREDRQLIIDGETRDLAFVIAPEPATLALLTAGGMVLLLRRRT
jgi:hypothetical protein